MSLTRRLSDKPQVPPALLMAVIVLGIAVLDCQVPLAGGDLTKALAEPTTESLNQGSS